MKKLLFISLLFSLVASCQSSNPSEQDTEEKQVNVEETESNFVDLKDKKFSFGINMNPCDGLTYSEYSIIIEFFDKDSVKITSSDVMNLGSPETYSKLNIQKGKYSWEDDKKLKINIVKSLIIKETLEGVREILEEKEMTTEIILTLDSCESSNKIQFIPEADNGEEPYGSYSLMEE